MQRGKHRHRNQPSNVCGMRLNGPQWGIIVRCGTTAWWLRGWSYRASNNNLLPVLAVVVVATTSPKSRKRGKTRWQESSKRAVAICARDRNWNSINQGTSDWATCATTGQLLSACVCVCVANESFTKNHYQCQNAVKWSLFISNRQRRHTQCGATS